MLRRTFLVRLGSGMYLPGQVIKPHNIFNALGASAGEGPRLERYPFWITHFYNVLSTDEAGIVSAWVIAGKDRSVARDALIEYLKRKSATERKRLVQSKSTVYSGHVEVLLSVVPECAWKPMKRTKHLSDYVWRKIYYEESVYHVVPGESYASREHMDG